MKVSFTLHEQLWLVKFSFECVSVIFFFFGTPKDAANNVEIEAAIS